MIPLSADRQIFFGTSSSIFAPSAYIRPWEGEFPVQNSSASIASNVGDAVTSLWLNGVNIEDVAMMENFLASHSGLVAHLLEAPDKISQYFGKSPLRVGLFSDPDSGDEHIEPYLEVETTLSPEEANERLSRINREWLLASGDQDLMFLNVTLKFA